MHVRRNYRREVVQRRDRYQFFFFFSSRRRHTRFDCDWSSDVCSSDLWSAPIPRLCVWTWSPASMSCVAKPMTWPRSEEHTSELQSQSNLVCRLLLEKKKTSPPNTT